NAGLQHRLADAEELPRMPERELEADRLAAGELAQPYDEIQQLERGVERRMPRRREAIHPDRHAARLGDLRRHLGARQHAAVAGLGALRDLDLDHLDLGGARLLGELFRVELAVGSAAAEIAAADLPDQVAAVLAVVAADRAL